MEILASAGVLLIKTTNLRSELFSGSDFDAKSPHEVEHKYSVYADKWNTSGEWKKFFSL